MNYEKICEEVLNCDDQIRYVGIYDYGELYDKMKPGIKNYLTKEETELSLSQAIYRWATRKKTVSKIGKPIFDMAKYEKIYRITIPIGGAGLILISAELSANVNEIADKALAIQSKYTDD